MNIQDFMGDSPAAVLAEVFRGAYAGLEGNIQITEDGAHVLIQSEEYSWAVTIRKVPHVSEEAKQEERA